MEIETIITYVNVLGFLAYVVYNEYKKWIADDGKVSLDEVLESIKSSGSIVMETVGDMLDDEE